MPDGRRRLSSSLKTVLAEKQDKPRLYPAALGAYVAGYKTLIVADRPDFVWCRLRGGNAEVIQAFNDVVGLHWDLPITVYRDPNAPAIWKIYGRDVAQYDEWDGASYIPPHGASHSFSQNPRSGVDPVWVYKRQFMPMLTRPIATGTMGVYIEPDFWYWGGHYNWWPGSGISIDNTYRPTGALNGVFVTIYMDGPTETPALLKGPEFPVWFPPADPGDYISIPSPSVGVPLAAAFITTGTSFIGWGEIYDLRIPVSAQADQTATGSLAFLDEGLTIGSAPKLNVAGSQISLTVSGLIATITHTPPQDQMGTMFWNGGVPLGTGTIVDLGDGLDGFISGSVVQIHARGGSGFDTFFCYATGSDVATYRKLLESSAVGSLQTITLAGIGATGTLAVFLTELNSTNLDFTPDGIWGLHLHALQSAGTKTTKLQAEFFKRAAGGVETIFDHSTIGAFDLIGADTEYDLAVFIREQTILTTDRIGVKVLAVTAGGGSAPTVEIRVEGTTESRLSFPVNTLSAAVLGVNEEGVFKGIVHTLDFGNNLDVTVSGTVARIEAIAGGGPGGGGIGIFGLDEGVPLGTGTWMNFTGAGIQATISGNVLNIDVSAGGTTIGAYQYGVPLGAIGNLDVGHGFGFTVSGTFGLLEERLEHVSAVKIGTGTFGSSSLALNRQRLTAPLVAVTLGSSVLVAQSLYAIPFFVERSVKVDAMFNRPLSAMATGVYRMGIYEDSGAHYPGNLLWDSGQIIGMLNAAAELPIRPVVGLKPGIYWAAFVKFNTVAWQSAVGSTNRPALLGANPALDTLSDFVSIGFPSGSVALPSTYGLSGSFGSVGAALPLLGIGLLEWGSVP